MLGVREEGAHMQELCATEKSGRWQTRCSSPLAWMPQHYVPKSVVVQ